MQLNGGELSFSLFILFSLPSTNCTAYGYMVYEKHMDKSDTLFVKDFNFAWFDIVQLAFMCLTSDQDGDCVKPEGVAKSTLNWAFIFKCDVLGLTRGSPLPHHYLCSHCPPLFVRLVCHYLWLAPVHILLFLHHCLVLLFYIYLLSGLLIPLPSSLSSFL